MNFRRFPTAMNCIFWWFLVLLTASGPNFHILVFFSGFGWIFGLILPVCEWVAKHLWILSYKFTRGVVFIIHIVCKYAIYWTKSEWESYVLQLKCNADWQEWGNSKWRNGNVYGINKNVICDLITSFK